MLGSATSVAHAWSHHAWGTWLSLSVMPDARSADAAVRAEPLERFLIEQGAALEAVLQQEEQWARSKVRNYPARPEVLAYRFEGQRFDCGSKLGYMQASVTLAQRHAEIGAPFSDWLARDLLKPRSP